MSGPLGAEGLPRGYPFKPEWEVTPREVKRRLSAMPGAGGDGLILLDCRQPEEWETAQIEGAVLIPMGEVPARADELETEDGGKGRSIVVYCHHGRRSLAVTATLRGLGFSNVRSMAGGIDLWSLDVDGGVGRY